MQAGEVRSLTACIKKTYKADHVLGFFKGISSPLCSIPFVNAIVFTAYGQANSLFSIDDTFLKGIISGSYAGLVNTVVVTPVELIKIKMQMQSNDPTIGSSKSYTSAWDCVKSVVKEEGIKGLFKGGTITIFREIPGYAAQFASFELALLFFHSYFGLEELNKGHVFIAGMIGGFNCWFWSYPQDVIKTKIQSGYKVNKGWDGGMTEMTKIIWRAEGFFGFWRGFSACFWRATIPNGFGFVVNDHVRNFLTDYISE